MEVERLEEFFRQFYEKDLLSIAAAGKRFVNIDFSLFDKFDPEMGDELLNDPEESLKLVEQALYNTDFPEGKLKMKAGFFNLPERYNIRIRNLRSKHIGKLLCLDGVVRRASEVKPEINIAVFQCSECGTTIRVKQEERTITPPKFCECGRKGGFALVDRELYDVRWIFIEEPYEIVTAEKPGEIRVYLKQDLTTPEMQRKTDPGNRLKITGVVKEIRKVFRGKLRTQSDIFVEANHVEASEIEWGEVIIDPEDEEKIKEFSKDPKIFEKFVDSLAPSMYGMDKIKEAITLQMFGGVRHILPDGTRIRGDIHILLVGDPSTGKSQILKLVSRIIPRGKYVAGRGATAAGLTATVIKDEEFMGGWVLEAGAMVLANKGIIAIDEFDKMSQQDQIAMHEALEQQTISIAKASIIATLPAQVSVLAGANPKYFRFDPYRPIAEQINIPDTLLARFDVKFSLRDIPNAEMDEKLASHILETRLDPSRVEPIMQPSFLRKYIAYARKYCKPEMTREAAEALKEFYLRMRNMQIGEDTIAITLRQNEGLMRMAEASAKIRLSEKVEKEDAERAINIVEYSIRELGYDYETGKIDIDRTEGVPASQRSKIHTILDIIDMLEKKLGKPVPKEEILTAAEEQGIKISDAEDLLRRLKTEGSIFEPKMNFIEKI